MPTRMRFGFFAAALLCASGAVAQTWEVGGTVGLVDDVSRRFSVDQFHSRDLAGWVGYEIEPSVEVRETFGSMRIGAFNSERTVTGSAGTVAVPRLTSLVDYATLDVSYDVVEGDIRTGIFGGIGGYKIRPDAAPAGFEEFRDPSETAFGWDAGVDGSVKIVSKLSALVRLTVHGFTSGDRRMILAAGAGLAYRF